jgi:DNA-binding NarL/FixJ family response regulator
MNPSRRGRALPPTRVGPIRVALVNDYQIVVDGLRSMLEPFAHRVRVVDTAVGDTPDAVADVALFDTFAGRRYALARVAEMSRDSSIGKVVLYTWDTPPGFLDDASAAHIDGVILKSETGAALVEALERVMRGERVGMGSETTEPAGTALSEREREVLALIASGASNREIAAELYLSVDTVKTHVQRLFRKLSVTNRTSAALEASGYGLSAPHVRVLRRTGTDPDG